MNNNIREWIYYLFPKRCPVCDGVINILRTFCDKCENTVTPISVKTCKRCGNPVKFCECKRYAYHFRGIVAPFLKEGNAEKAIYNYKFKPNIDVADYFAEYMAKYVENTFPDVVFDCVTSVPIHRSKKKLRGFSHSQLLAKRVASNLCIPYKKLLFQKQKNLTQHSLGAADRFKNVKGAYSALKNDYVNVLLVDDIKTTGATLDECARRLMLSGTENVYCVTAVISACNNSKVKL